MAGARRAANKPLVIVNRPKTVRDLIRRHLREEGKDVQHDLSQWWQMTPQSAHRLMYDVNRRLAPQHIDAVIEGLRLDEFDANELRYFGALARGWNINPTLLNALKKTPNTDKKIPHREYPYGRQ